MNEQAKQALNREIAEALGYRVEVKDWVNGYRYPVTAVRLFRPDGAEVITDWEWNGDTGGYGDEAHAWAQVPDYAADLNAVADVLPREWYDMSIRTFLAGGYVATVLQDDPPMGIKGRWEGRGETRHEAAARALLAWALATKARAT